MANYGDRDKEAEFRNLARKGANAKLAGLNDAKIACPYPEGSEAHRIWMKGWNNVEWAN